MIVVDTSVWICYLRNDDRDISAALKFHLRRKDVIAVSAAFGELLQGARSKRERQIVEGLWENLPKIDERYLFIEAGRLSRLHKLHHMGVGLNDAYILSAALTNSMAIWTLDKKLLNVIDVIRT